MKRIALIACSNGYGHIRRLLILADALIKNNSHPVLFAPIHTVRRIVKTRNIIYPEVIDFDTQTSRENWLNGTAINWVNFTPNLDNFDIVISDNLIEILLIRPDAWLSGSFFWHESVNKFPQRIKERSRELLLKYKPKMISSSLFSSKILKEYTQLYEVGIFSDINAYSIPSKGQSKNDALISCGKGGDVTGVTQNFINKLSKTKNTVFDTVWIEPNLFPESAPIWMKKANFTKEMYSSLMVSIIRPSVGTITDSFLYQSKVFLYYEASNLEMRDNAISIDVLNLGVDSIGISDAWEDALFYMKQPALQRNFLKKVRGVSANGAKESANIILNLG